MGSNKKRKLRQKQSNEEEELPLTSYPHSPSSMPTTSASASASASELQLRNWAELPDLPLHSIFTRNPDLPDFLSFSSVCRSWKSTSATSPTSVPPLLLIPVLYPRNPNRRPRRSCPPFYRLQTLLTGRTFKFKIPSETLKLRCLSYSNGRLIFLSYHTPLLADIFTGKVTRIRPLPPSVDDFPYFRLALLADQNVFLLDFKSVLFSYRPGMRSWSRLAIADRSRDIVSLAFHRGKLFGLDSISGLMVVDLGGRKDEIFIGGWKLMEVAAPVEPPEEPAIHFSTFDHRLVGCGGELLLLCLNKLSQPIRCRITVYRLDFERLVWVRKESLGDWCMFLDPVGHCPVMCPNPDRWGGRSNCIYFVEKEPNNWVLVPLGEDIVTDSAVESPQRVYNPRFRWWPMPVWVYPSMLFSGRSN